MQILRKAKAPRYCRPEGITSYLLASPRTSQAHHLTTTQVYFILEGAGVMIVGTETQAVGTGDCVFFPTDTPHRIRNEGKAVLRYFSAAAPAFDASDLLSPWPLASESEEVRGQK
jgi:mannose-6-phosphate isomerase-like protein (cupin superfamily)